MVATSANDHLQVCRVNLIDLCIVSPEDSPSNAAGNLLRGSFRTTLEKGSAWVQSGARSQMTHGPGHLIKAFCHLRRTSPEA